MNGSTIITGIDLYVEVNLTTREAFTQMRVRNWFKSIYLDNDPCLYVVVHISCITLVYNDRYINYASPIYGTKGLSSDYYYIFVVTSKMRNKKNT